MFAFVLPVQAEEISPNNELAKSELKKTGEPGTKPNISEDLEKSMSQAEKKLPTILLQLTDDKYLLQGTTKNQLIQEMKKDGQISEKPSIKNAEKNPATGVYVYIEINKNTKFNALDPYVLETVNTDRENNLAVLLGGCKPSDRNCLSEFCKKHRTS